MVLEDTDEIGTIRKAALIASMGDRVPLFEQLFGQRDFARLKVTDERYTEVLAKYCGQIGCRNVDRFGNFADR